MSRMGPREKRVRETLSTRLANVIDSEDQDVRSCFAGLFNGAWQGHIMNGNVFFGKAECEWAWPSGWERLRELGLITYELSERPNHPTIGGSTTLIAWQITEKGWSVREDDVAYFREFIAAYNSDLEEREAPAHG